MENKKNKQSLKHNFVNKIDFDKKIHIDYAIICTPSGSHFDSAGIFKKKIPT